MNHWLEKSWVLVIHCNFSCGSTFQLTARIYFMSRTIGVQLELKLWTSVDLCVCMVQIQSSKLCMQHFGWVFIQFCVRNGFCTLILMVNVHCSLKKEWILTFPSRYVALLISGELWNAIPLGWQKASYRWPVACTCPHCKNSLLVECTYW